MIAITLFIGAISLMIGVNLLYRSVVNEAGARVGQDLNVARVIYDRQIECVRLALELSASTPSLADALSSGNEPEAARALNAVALKLNPNILGISDSQGRIIYRREAEIQGDALNTAPNPLVVKALESKATVAGSLVMDNQELALENPELARFAPIRVRKNPEDMEAQPHEMTKALMVGAAAPVFSGDRLVGVIYGGFLLNKDTQIVDKIGETVFKNEKYKGRSVGTATIFYQNLRVATSVKDPQGYRAIGTFASEEVNSRVLGKGEKWTDRAKVLDEWYITAYEPLTDIMGRRVGMLYVGVLEAKYNDIRTKAISVFVKIILASAAIAIILGWLITRRIMAPVSHLIQASAEISRGNFTPDIGPISRDDIGQLQRKFLKMTTALKEREESQKAQSEIRLIQSEKQASVGKLAAGVAHEINNPLTAVLTFTHMILRRTDLPGEVRSDLETVASQTERVRKIVKSLLDFSRQSALTPESLDVNGLIQESVKLLENQALIKGVSLSFRGDDNLPLFTLDHNQCQSVLINMIINALDATPSGGKISIQTKRASLENANGVEIKISDTGTGIASEHMDKLFDPFFTTKEVGKGTGLGLAVSAGIIQRHGGSISVNSTLGEGTAFTIWLPMADNPE
ncbi:histidine kinase [Desulfatibacillum aliphaticivorans]|uniref:histidine kinase n=1 Tax=Desulfatibacillum aliphaticivorans TaxID=218208 RepID=B8FF41_DESAL|nr:cache domain-containing protein [Desulfatibacillum aliphaticivorans]ACL03858.1 histidine kinase [Desulfatibacillum aliphaticivorans]